jgi:hypothetical protein
MVHQEAAEVDQRMLAVQALAVKETTVARPMVIVVVVAAAALVVPGHKVRFRQLVARAARQVPTITRVRQFRIRVAVAAAAQRLVVPLAQMAATVAVVMQTVQTQPPIVVVAAAVLVLTAAIKQAATADLAVSLCVG